MEAKAVDFFSYSTEDMAKSIEFYRDTLGLKLIGEYGDDTGVFWAEFERRSSTIALHVPGMGPPKAAVAVAVDDVQATTEELKAKGVEVIYPATETTACWVATITDPDGNPIMLHRRHDGACG